MEKALAADKINEIAEQKRQLFDLQKDELKPAYTSWEKYKGIPKQLATLQTVPGPIPAPASAA